MKILFYAVALFMFCGSANAGFGRIGVLPQAPTPAPPVNNVRKVRCPRCSQYH